MNFYYKLFTTRAMLSLVSCFNLLSILNLMLLLHRYYISKGAIVDQLGGDLNSTPLHWAVRYAACNSYCKSVSINSYSNVLCSTAVVIVNQTLWCV